MPIYAKIPGNARLGVFGASVQSELGSLLWAEEARKGSMEEAGLRMDRMWMWQEEGEHYQTG